MRKKIARMERPLKFISRLQEEGKLKRINIEIINENLTTQTCGKCRVTYKFKGEIYKCKKSSIATLTGFPKGFFIKCLETGDSCQKYQEISTFM